MGRGRPLRFLGAVLAGWTGLRVMMLWPAAAPIQVVDAAPAIARTPRARLGRPIVVQELPPVHRWAGAESAALSTANPQEPNSPDARTVVASASSDGGQGERTSVSVPATVAVPPQTPAAVGVRLQSLPNAPAAISRPRFAGDAWLIARPNGGDSLAFGQLGASQAGARVTYALDAERRVALSARIAAPLHGRGAEAGLGVDLQPTRLPIHLLAEARAPLDGGPARPAAELFGGVTAPLPARLRLDAYAQGGGVWRRGGFADGAALVVRPLAERGGVRLEAGGGASGAAQRGAARLDVGPTLALAVPAGGVGLRLGVDYRLRAAGRARPGSGPALTLGTSF